MLWSVRGIFLLMILSLMLLGFREGGPFAFRDIDRKFPKIWEYIKSKEEPNINQYLLRITILKNGKILCEYDLMQKRLLSRKEALDRIIWNRTITILKDAVKEFEEEIEIEGTLWDRVKLIFNWIKFRGKC